MGENGPLPGCKGAARKGGPPGEPQRGSIGCSIARRTLWSARAVNSPVRKGNGSITPGGGDTSIIAIYPGSVKTLFILARFMSQSAHIPQNRQFLIFQIPNFCQSGPGTDSCLPAQGAGAAPLRTTPAPDRGRRRSYMRGHGVETPFWAANPASAGSPDPGRIP